MANGHAVPSRSIHIVIAAIRHPHSNCPPPHLTTNDKLNDIHTLARAHTHTFKRSIVLQLARSFNFYLSFVDFWLNAIKLIGALARARCARVKLYTENPNEPRQTCGARLADYIICVRSDASVARSKKPPKKYSHTQTRLTREYICFASVALPELDCRPVYNGHERNSPFELRTILVIMCAPYTILITILQLHEFIACAHAHTRIQTLGKTCTTSTIACPTQEKKTSVISSAAARFPHSPENQSIFSTRTCTLGGSQCWQFFFLIFAKSCTVQNALIAPIAPQKNRGCNQCTSTHLNCSVRFEWRISQRGISGAIKALAHSAPTVASPMAMGHGDPTTVHHTHSKPFRVEIMSENASPKRLYHMTLTHNVRLPPTDSQWNRRKFSLDRRGCPENFTLPEIWSDENLLGTRRLPLAG